MTSPSAISILSVILIIQAFVISTSYADPAPDPKPAPAVKITGPIVPSSAAKVAAVSQVAEKKIDKDPLDAQESAQYGSRNPAPGQSSYGSQSAGSYDSSSNGQSNSYGNENNGGGYHAPSTPQQSAYNSAAPVPRPAGPAANAYRPQGNTYGQQQPAAQGYGQQNGASYGNQGNGQSYGQDTGSEAGSSDADSYGSAGYGGDSGESLGDSSEDSGDNGYGSSGLGDVSGGNGFSGSLGGDEGLENSGADDGYDNGGSSSYGNGDSGYGGQAEYGNAQPVVPQHPQPPAAAHQNSNNNNYQSRPSTHPISASGPQAGNSYAAGNNNHGSINNRPLAGGYNAVKSQQSTNGGGYNNAPANNSPGAPVSSYAGTAPLAPAAPSYNHPPSGPSSSAYSQPSSAGYSSASHSSAPPSSSYPPPPPAQQSYGQQAGYSNSGHGSSGQSSYPSSDSYGGSQGGYQQQAPQGLKSPAHSSNSYPPPPAQSYNAPPSNNGYNSAPPAEPAYPQSPAQGTKSVYGSQLSPLPQSQPPAYSSSAPAYPSSAPSAGPSYDTKSPPPQPAAPAQGYSDGASSPPYDGQEPATGTKTGLPMSYGGFTPLGRPLNGGRPLVLEIVQKPPQDNNYQVTVSDRPASKAPPAAPRPRPSSASSYDAQSGGYEAPAQNTGSKLYSGPSDQSYQGQTGLSQYTAGADGVYEGAPLAAAPDYDSTKYELTDNPYLDSGYSGFPASVTEDINPALLSGQPGYGSSSAAAAGLAATSGYRPPRKGLKIPSGLGYPSAAYPPSSYPSAAGFESLTGLSSNQPQTPAYPRPIEVQYRTRTKGKNYLKAGYNLDYSGGIPYLADFTRKPYSTKFRNPLSIGSVNYGGNEAIDLSVPMKLHKKPRIPLPVLPPPILHHGRVPNTTPISEHGLPTGIAEYGLGAGGLTAMASSPWLVPSMGLPKGFGSPGHKVSTGMYESAASAHSLESKPYESKPYGSMSIEEAKSLLKAAGYNLDAAKPGGSAGSEETTPSPEDIVKSVNEATSGSGSESYKTSSSRLVPTIIKTRFTSLYKALSKNRPFFG